MTKRSKFLLIAAGLAALAVATVIAFEIHRLSSVQIINLTDEQVREMLSRELPIGTDKSLVKRFLDAKPWPYSEIGQSIQSMIRDASHNILIRTDIQIRFFFDSKGKLVSYEIMDINTGP
jgi:hypothetical protein